MFIIEFLSVRASTLRAFRILRSAQAAKNGSLHQFFSPGGLLAKTHPAYEFRRGQFQMAQAVEQAIEQRRHLIVEAGTGPGKRSPICFPSFAPANASLFPPAQKICKSSFSTRTFHF